MGKKTSGNKSGNNCCISYNGKTVWYKSGHPTKEVKEMHAHMMADMRAEIDAIKRRTEATKAKTEKIRQKRIALEEKCRKLEEENLKREIKNSYYQNNYSYTSTQNLGGINMANSTISSVSEARYAQQVYDFNKKVQQLRSDIEYRMKRKLEDDTPELKNANAYLASQMKKLLDMPIYNEKDYEYVYWLFNYGNLRTEAEINARKKAENDAHYVCSGQYERDCFANKSAWGWGSFFIVFFLCLLFFWDGLWIFAVPIALLFALIASLIGMAIASKQNIDNAMSHGVPKNHPRLQHDKNELKMAGIGAIGAAAAIGHSEYKAGKDIADVDHWPKQK